MATGNESIAPRDYKVEARVRGRKWRCFACGHLNPDTCLDCACDSYRWYRIGLNYSTALLLAQKLRTMPEDK